MRATRDIDIVVSADEGNIARLKAALRDVFDDPEIDRIAAADLAGDYPAIQYAPPASDYWIDILARLGEAFRYGDVEAEIVQIEGISVRVVTPQMLYRMKRDTVRLSSRLRRRFSRGEMRANAERPDVAYGSIAQLLRFSNGCSVPLQADRLSPAKAGHYIQTWTLHPHRDTTSIA